jgi:uncharacterized protein (DUF924 family)
MATTADEVLRFWREAGMQAWFNGGAAFDRQCETRFLDAHLLAARRGCEDWLESADGALAAGHDAATGPLLRAFFYLPFEHSEDMADQQRAVELFGAPGMEEYLPYAIAHRDVIARFGRFPHRNRALGRDSTAEEQAWLDAGGGF